MFFTKCIIIISGIVFWSLFGVGIGLLCPSWTMGFYLLSLLSIYVGIVLVCFSKIYQRKQYADFLLNKRCGHENKLIERSKIRCLLDFIFKRRFLPSQKHIFLILFILSVCLTLIPYMNWVGGNEVLDLFNIFRQTMQIFVVDGGVNDFINNCSDNVPYFLQSISGAGIIFYNCYAAIIWVAAGLLFAFNILNIFAKELEVYFDYWVAHPLSEVYVMSELNEESVTLAESIFCQYYDSKRKEKTENEKSTSEKCTKKACPRIYFCDVYETDKENNSELIFRAKLVGAVVMKKDIAIIKIKSFSKKNTFYLIGKNESENVGQAQQICALLKDIRIKKELNIYVYASSVESELVIDDMHDQIEQNMRETEVKI